MDKEAAGIVQHAVPSAEVAGAVGCVQEFLEIHAHDLPDSAAEHNLLELLHMRHIAHVKDDRDLPTVAALSVQDGLVGVNGERFLADDIQAAV